MARYPAASVACRPPPRTVSSPAMTQGDPQSRFPSSAEG
jgi:hypothetical protein